MKKVIFIFAALLVAVPALQSCLKDEEELFDENASVRMQSTLDATQEILVAAEYGWVFEMYPEDGQSYGGYAFTLVFDDEKVAARSEIMGDNTYEVSSYYKMTNDDGPVLSFDTYNEIIHYFSTPSSSAYQGYEGEFEFVIMDAEDDLITLQGKKTGNTMYMHALETDPESYLDAVTEMESSIYFCSLTGTVGGIEVYIELDTEYRQATFSYGEEDEETIAYAVTDKGVRLYSDITLGSDTLDELYADIADETFVTSGEASVSLVWDKPEFWREYDVFEGDYTFYYYSGKYKASVTLTPAGDNSSYIMSGLNSNYTLTLTYNLGEGRLELHSQEVGTYGSNYVWFCAWDSTAGYLSWSTSYGMYLEWNGDEDSPVYEFYDLGAWTSYTVDSFILWQLDSSSSSAGNMSGASAWYTNGTYQFPLLTNLTKVN